MLNDNDHHILTTIHVKHFCFLQEKEILFKTKYRETCAAYKENVTNIIVTNTTRTENHFRNSTTSIQRSTYFLV